MNTIKTFPESITRQQVIEALAVMGIDAHDVRTLFMSGRQIRVQTPYDKINGEAVHTTEIAIPVEY